MSLSDLLDDEPGAIVMRKALPGAKDADGLPIEGLQNVGPVSGRFVELSAQQIEAWRTKAVQATYEFVTEDPSPQNGDVLVANEDGRNFRVTGSGGRTYSKGTIPTYYTYPCLATGKMTAGAQ